MADPWAKRIKWGGLTIIWLTSLWMAWNGGSASTLLSENATDMERLIQTIEREAPRIEAEREALKRCKMAQAPEDCG